MRPPVNPARGTSRGLGKIKEWSLPEDVVQLKKQWQPEAYLMNRIIGQVGKVNHLTSVTVASCDMRPVWIDPVDGDEFELDDLLRMEPDDSEFDPKILEQARAVKRVDDAFVPPLGGKAELLRTAALHVRIAGEAFLVATPTKGFGGDGVVMPGDSPELVWEFISALELKTDAFRRTVRDQTGIRNTVISEGAKADGTYIARLHQPDPEFSELPDCLLRKALPDCRQYVQLRDVIDAAIRSRLSAGALLVDESLSFGPANEADDPGDDEESIDPLTLDLLDHMGAPIEDLSSAASMVPLVLRGEGEQLKNVRMLDLSNDGRNLDALQVQRKEVLTSVGMILDAPPEMMTGRGELNHWTGFAVDSDFSSKHVIPLGELIASFSTEGYLQSMLVEYEGFDDADAGSWVYRFDASNITAKADKGVTFIRLYDRKVISEASLRQANGATEADAPTPEERRERMLLELVAANPTYAPLLTLVEGFEDIDLSFLPAPGAGNQLPAGDPTPPSPNGPNGPQGPRVLGPAKPSADPAGDGVGGDSPSSGDGAPATPGEKLPGDGMPSNGAASVVGLLIGEADAAMDRALERAGARAASRYQARKVGDVDRLRSRPKSETLSLLTGDDFAKMGLSLEGLLRPEWDDFAHKAARIVKPWVVETIGRNGSVSAEVSRSIADELAARLQTLAMTDRGLSVYDDGLKVPAELVVGALETVGPVRY
jgi:hypothetical protein